MRVAFVAAALVLSGCMLPFCGPTIYHLSGVTASVFFEVEAWDAERAAAGARAAGFNVTSTTPSLMLASRETAYLGAEVGGSPSSIRLFTGIPVTGVEGERAEVDREADAIIGRMEYDVRSIFTSFAEGSGWPGQSPIQWDKGMLHGDC